MTEEEKARAVTYHAESILEEKPMTTGQKASNGLNAATEDSHSAQDQLKAASHGAEFRAVEKAPLRLSGNADTRPLPTVGSIKNLQVKGSNSSVRSGPSIELQTTTVNTSTPSQQSSTEPHRATSAGRLSQGIGAAILEQDRQERERMLSLDLRREESKVS
jgi:hypothetical protein